MSAGWAGPQRASVQLPTSGRLMGRWFITTSCLLISVWVEVNFSHPPMERGCKPKAVWSHHSPWLWQNGQLLLAVTLGRSPCRGSQMLSHLCPLAMTCTGSLLRARPSILFSSLS